MSWRQIFFNILEAFNNDKRTKEMTEVMFPSVPQTAFHISGYEI
jgi:hypothetical protein